MSIQRIHTGWNQKNKSRQLGQIAGAVAVNIWKISQKTLLSLENEGFETSTWEDRFNVLEEVSCFLIYVSSNELMNLPDDKKHTYITDIAIKISDTIISNKQELKIESVDQTIPFIDKLNSRLSEYGEFPYDIEPSYKTKIILGNHLMNVMGDLDNNWIRMYVVDSEIPKMIPPLKMAIKSLIKE
ncbi:MAG: hypothetical protein CMD90_03505 [Gammaproteobacteria bacterium]|nr:hypothetical protein [Gammaproteobacteria bacterium]|tara:strand:+ start:267 stop:821 length:555 start_codon:yes stop_codon:yes gene_type:complete